MAPKGIELASAYISVSLNTDGAGRELKNFVRGIRDINVDVDANVRPASQGVGKWRTEEERNEVNIDVDADTKGAKANVGRWRAQEEANAVNIRVRADTRNARREVDALSSNLFKFGRSDVLKLNLGAAAITSLPALASGLAQVAAGITQVSQAALALPGIMGGATASIGTLVFGLSGVGDAYDAMNKAADDAAKSGSNVAAKQRAQMSASFGLRNAIVDEARARKDVNKAIRDTHRDLQDLNLEMRGGVISEKRAVLELEKARQRLYSGDFTDYREALLDVEEAELRVDESRTRNQRTAADLVEANAKGVMGSDRVVDANENLIRSEQGVAQAHAAVAAASEDSSAAQENAALAMSKLSPEAQDFVNALMDVSGPFQTLRNLVQGNIFRGMDQQLRDLAVKSMPMLEEGLGGLGDAWHNTFEELFRVAGEDETQGMLSRIFGNTEEAQNILTGAIDPLVEGLGTLTEAGSRALPRLAEGFVGATNRFADFIEKADESGKLDEWIGESITALGHLGEIALNVGKMFTGISEAAGGDFLENLERWTTNWQTWLNSAEGQNTLRDIFAEGKRVFEQWKPILEDIPGLFKGIYDGASTWIGLVTTVVAPLTDFLADHPDLVKTAAAAYMVFKSAQVLGSFTDLLTMFSTTLPGEAAKSGTKAGKGFHGAFDTAVKAAPWIALGTYVSDQITESFDKAFQTKTSETGMPGSGIWFFNLLKDPAGTLNKTFGSWFAGGAPGSANGVLPGSPGTVNGQTPTVGGIPIPGLQTGGFSNPNNEDTGGKLTTETQNIQSYLRDTLGFQGDIGGYRPPDGFNEHSSGKASDVMVQSAAQGNALLPNLLQRPGVEYIIWQQKTWYPDGRVDQMEDRGSPTQNHMDHLHVKTYDTGGVWPDGTLGMNTSGKPEFVLSPQDIEYLKSQGIDPASLQKGQGPIDPNTTVHGTSAGGAPGPQAPLPGRTEGYIPATAGNTAPVGQGGLSNFLDLGESFFHNLIDTGAQLGSMAVSAAAAAGSFGAGAAAGPAASAGIQMAAEAGKRGVSYLYDLGGIWGEALVEQAFPFGAPRWLGSADPMAFMPQGIPGLGEKKAPGTMGNAKAAVASWAQPGNPAMAAMGNSSQGAQAALGAARSQPSYQPAQPKMTPPGGVQGPAQATPQFDPANPATWLNFSGVFDDGGMFPPKSFAANLSNRPEFVFTQKQMAGMAKTAATAANAKAGGDVHFHSRDDSEMWRRYQWEQRRKARQHSGRP